MKIRFNIFQINKFSKNVQYKSIMKLEKYYFIIILLFIILLSFNINN